MTLRIATFNLENLDDVAGDTPSLADRIAIMRPQLARINADVLCLQEVHSQGPAGSRTLAALDALLQDTHYAAFNRSTTLTVGGELYDERNLVVLTRFNITNTEIQRDGDGPRPSYQLATAIPPDQNANPVQWERPILHVDIDLGNNQTLHVVNLHLKSKIARAYPARRSTTSPGAPSRPGLRGVSSRR